jgi:hypothetical protein
MERLTRAAFWAALTSIVLLAIACGGGASKPKQEGPGPPRETQAIEEGEAKARTVEVTALAVSQGPDGYFGEASGRRYRRPAGRESRSLHCCWG